MKELSHKEISSRGGKAHSKAHMSKLGKLSAKKRKANKKKLSPTK